METYQNVDTQGVATYMAKPYKNPSVKIVYRHNPKWSNNKYKDSSKEKVNSKEVVEKTDTKLKKKQTFFEMVPIAEKWWDYEKNPSIDVRTLAPFTTMEAHFICDRGHHFTKSIRNFTLTPTCRECEKINSSIAVVAPELLKYFDYEKNTTKPDQIKPNSTKNLYWKCPDCGYTWKQKPTNRINNNTCPICDVKYKVLDESKSLRGNRSEICDVWDEVLNGGLKPEHISKQSTKEVYLKCCNDPTHPSFKIVVNTIPKFPPYGCPVCKADAWKNSRLINVRPDLLKYIDLSLNPGVDINTISIGGMENLQWKCEKGHTFARRISNMVKQSDCPYCNQNLVVNNQKLMAQWDFEKNKDIDVNKISCNSKKTVGWKCGKCGYTWDAQISSRNISKGLCPACEHRIVVAAGITDLFTLVPGSKEQYDFGKNKGIDPYSLSVTDNKNPIWWKCNACGYSWQAFIYTRVKMQDGKYILVDCPSCSKSYQLLSNSFKFPELKKRFLSEKNGCEFDDVSGDARKKLYWWHCDLCGEDFKSVIDNMIRGLNTSAKGCTYCAGKSVKRENSFGVRHPELLAEYSKENTVDPFAVTEFSGLTVKWNCLIHKDTQWEASFHSRAIGYGSCPVCKNYNYSGKFFEKYPDFKMWYDSEKNIRPFESYSIQSNEPVWWKCDKGHSFQWPIYHWNNTEKFVCKVCDGTIIIPGVNDLESQNPKLAKELSPAFEKKANEIYYQAVTPVLWRCLRCQSDYARRVCDREVGDDTCPYCKGKLVNEDINSLKARKPELILEWSSKNSKNVSEIYWLSTQYAIWNCPKCNMEYEAVIKSRYAGDTACPYCNGRTPIPGVNSVDIVKPWLVSEWSQKNDRPITEFLETSSYYAKWNCSNCGEEFSAEIRNRGSDGDCDCPYCNGRKPIPGVNSVDIIKPQLALEWSPENKRSITEFLETSSYYAKWVCLTCKGTFSAKIKDRDEQDDACPYCRRTRVLPGVNSADVEKPWLLDEWSPDNAEPLRNYMISSAFRALWICPTCNQEYEASIRSREKGDNICPCCNKKRPYPGVNTFAALHKDLMKRWSWQNNYLLCDPDQILERYNKVVWWECPNCKQLYRCSPQKILYYEKRHMESCSFCKGYRRKQRHFI